MADPVNAALAGLLTGQDRLNKKFDRLVALAQEFSVVAQELAKDGHDQSQRIESAIGALKGQAESLADIRSDITDIQERLDKGGL